MGITSSGRVAYSTLLLVRSPPPFPAPSATLRWIWRQRRAVAQAIPLETSQSVDSALTGAAKPPTHPTTTRRDTKLRASPTAVLTSAFGAQRWRTRLAAAKAVSPVTSRTSRPSSRLRSRSSTGGSSPTASPASVPRPPPPPPLSAWPRVTTRLQRKSSEQAAGCVGGCRISPGWRTLCTWRRGGCRCWCMPPSRRSTWAEGSAWGLRVSRGRLCACSEKWMCVAAETLHVGMAPDLGAGAVPCLMFAHLIPLYSLPASI